MREQSPTGINETWRNPGSLKAPAFRMIGNLYYVGNRDVSCHLLSSDEGHVLIDTGFATTVPILRESITSLGFELKDVGSVLNTHGHADHCGGNRRMVQSTGAETALHRRDVVTVETGTELTCAYYTYGIEEFETFKVDIPLEGGQVLRYGETTIKIHHTPGHTPGTCSFEIPIRHEGRELTAFLFGGPGQWTFNDHSRSQGYEGDIEEYGRSLEFLRGFDVDVPLGAHPGQNRTLEKYEVLKINPEGGNPFIDPEHWTAFLDRLQENYDSLG
jgi:metallo-beta-lactamase class B